MQFQLSPFDGLASSRISHLQEIRSDCEHINMAKGLKVVSVEVSVSVEFRVD